MPAPANHSDTPANHSDAPANHSEGNNKGHCLTLEVRALRAAKSAPAQLLQPTELALDRQTPAGPNQTGVRLQSATRSLPI
jgi:hypothetical protein